MSIRTPALALIAAAGLAAAQDVYVFDTTSDTVTLNGQSTDTLAGSTVTYHGFVSGVGDRWVVAGDVALTGDAIRFVGNVPASLWIAGNLVVDDASSISASGEGPTPGAGGGAGGSGGAGGDGGTGGNGGSGGAGGTGGPGGAGAGGTVAFIASYALGEANIDVSAGNDNAGAVIFGAFDNQLAPTFQPGTTEVPRTVDVLLADSPFSVSRQRPVPGLRGGAAPYGLYNQGFTSVNLLTFFVNATPRDRFAILLIEDPGASMVSANTPDGTQLDLPGDLVVVLNMSLDPFDSVELTTPRATVPVPQVFPPTARSELGGSGPFVNPAFSRADSYVFMINDGENPEFTLTADITDGPYPGRVTRTFTPDDLRAGSIIVSSGFCAADLAPPQGVLDLSDINAFVSGCLNSEPIADLAPPFGVFDLADINTFVGAFLAGCP